MKSIKYIGALLFIYFGGVKLMGSIEVETLIGLIVSPVAFLSVIPYFLLPAIGLLEILIGVSLLNSVWARYHLKLVMIYIPMLIVFLILTQNIIFTESPFILSWSISALISHICLIGIIFMLRREEVKCY